MTIQPQTQVPLIPVTIRGRLERLVSSIINRSKFPGPIKLAAREWIMSEFQNMDEDMLRQALTELKNDVIPFILDGPT